MKGLLVLICLLLAAILLVLCGAPPLAIGIGAFAIVMLIGFGNILRMAFRLVRKMRAAAVKEYDR